MAKVEARGHHVALLEHGPREDSTVKRRSGVSALQHGAHGGVTLCGEQAVQLGRYTLLGQKANWPGRMRPCCVGQRNLPREARSHFGSSDIGFSDFSKKCVLCNNVPGCASCRRPYFVVHGCWHRLLLSGSRWCTAACHQRSACALTQRVRGNNGATGQIPYATASESLGTGAGAQPYITGSQ